MAPDDKIYKEARKRVRRRRKFYSHVLTYLAMPRFSHSSIGTAILAIDGCIGCGSVGVLEFSFTG
jgi:hypothetical protein